MVELKNHYHCEDCENIGCDYIGTNQQKVNIPVKNPTELIGQEDGKYHIVEYRQAGNK